MTKVITGLERLMSEKPLQDSIKGNIGYLCHSASIDSNFNTGVVLLQKLFGATGRTEDLRFLTRTGNLRSKARPSLPIRTLH